MIDSPESDRRLGALVAVLEALVAGDFERRAEVSKQHDLIDAIAHGVNVLAGEVRLLTTRLTSARDDALAAAKEQRRFLHTLSHELRTPLAVILASLEMAARPEVTVERRRALFSRARNSADVLGRLVEDLLDFSRVEAGKLHIEAVACSPQTVVRDVIDGLRPEAEAKGVAIRQLGGTPRLLLDPVRLHQVLSNLIGNAVKFTERGAVTIQLIRSEADLVIEVDDTGPGIPLQGQELLFRPFSRLAPHGVVGAGLGLAISRRLLQAMGGSLVLVRSDPGQGSTFRVSLPAVEPAPAAQSSVPVPVQPNAALRGCRILLAEDDGELGEVMLELLAIAGADVSWERDGNAACERGGAQSFDLLVLDIGMPHRDGLASMRWLRAAGITTPAVAFTADGSSETRRECLEAGFDAHVAKGLGTQALLDMLAALSRRTPDDRSAPV